MKKELILAIENAFKDVPKGKIGIRQASAIDSRFNPGDLYEDPKKYQAACIADGKETHWIQIPFQVLAADPAVFSHMDDAGLKFVLPAMMRWSLSEGYSDPSDVIQFLLMKLVAHNQEGATPIALVSRLQLSPEQVAVIVKWLNFIVTEENAQSFNSREARNFEEWKSLLR